MLGWPCCLLFFHYLWVTERELSCSYPHIVPEQWQRRLNARGTSLKGTRRGDFVTLMKSATQEPDFVELPDRRLPKCCPLLRKTVDKLVMLYSITPKQTQVAKRITIERHGTIFAELQHSAAAQQLPVLPKFRSSQRNNYARGS